jgi:hypothetical protein
VCDYISDSGRNLTQSSGFRSASSCYTTAGGTKPLEINLNGSWSTPINIGASGLPAGVSVAGTTLIDFFY